MIAALSSAGPSWADPCDRWSVETRIEHQITKRNQIAERCVSLPLSPVVWSTLILSLYLHSLPRLLCLLEIVNSEGMSSGYCRHLAPAPRVCVSVLAGESVWLVSVTS